MSEEEAPKVIRDRNQKVRDEAAQKRKARRDAERRAAVSRNLDAGEMVDDALARGTQAASGWLKRHFNKLQWVIVAVAVVGIGSQIYRSRVHKTEAKSTDALMAGVFAGMARIGEEAESGPDPMTGITDPREHFADNGARLKAAEERFRAANGSPTIKSLAELGLAGVLFDAGKYKDALAAYQSVQGSALAKTDSDARLRSVEGAALAQEALGNKEAAQKGFSELAKSDLAYFAALGLYHQGRLAFAAGEREPAKDFLKKALEKAKSLTDEKAGSRSEGMPGTVAQASKELLGVIDPSAVPAAKNQVTPEQLKQLMQQAMQKQAGESKDIDKEKLNEILRQSQQPQPAPAPAPSGAP